VLDVGRIVRPHGLKGQVVVELWTNVESRMAAGSEMFAGGRRLVVSAASRLPDSGGQARWVVTFAGPASREDAEALRDCVLSAEPVEIEGAMWIHELVGADLFEPDGSVVGRVEAVEANPASDLLLLSDGRVIPLTFVTRDGNRLVVQGPPGLLDPP